MYTKEDHTFMICAYQENPYLEECILSVLQQTVLGTVVVSTSTPNDYIWSLAQKYNLPMIVNKGKGDTVDNMNFAYSHANTRLVTLCHQDDYYCPQYLERILRLANDAKSRPIIIFTNYFEDRKGELVQKSRFLNIKKLLNWPLKFRFLRKSRWVRVKLLSFGDAICTPAVTINKQAVMGNLFSDENFYYVNDWVAWMKCARQDGEFLYDSTPLMVHRIWEGTNTTFDIENNYRSIDELKFLKTLWPAPIAKIICHFYAHAQDSNTIGEIT